MPAYFSIYLEFKRNNICPEFVSDITAALHDAGIVFKNGYKEDKEMPLERIIEWNQKKLSENFIRGIKEHYSHGYKQSLYTFDSFSETRAYWLNQYPCDDECVYEIIIPEHDVLNYDLSTYNNDAVERIFSAAASIWQCPHISAIQTTIENDSERIHSLNEIKQGFLPNIRPFAVIPSEYAEKIDCTGLVTKNISRGGVMLLRPWNQENTAAL